MTDRINHALEPSKYLEEIRNETDREIRFTILKKFFTEKITRDVYQNMDLLQMTSKEDFDEFKKMYIIIAKNIYLNLLMAVDCLVSERKEYKLSPSDTKIDMDFFRTQSEKKIEEESAVKSGSGKGLKERISKPLTKPTSKLPSKPPTKPSKSSKPLDDFFDEYI